MEQLLRVGVITTTHGLRGEVKVYPTTESKERYLDLEEVVLRHGKEEKILRIEKVRFFKNLVIVKFEDYDRIEDVENFRQAELYVTRENAIPLEDGEYYIGDLIDMNVYLQNGEKFGTVTDVIQTGANDVYVINTKEYKEVLVPAIPLCIKEIDTEANKMIIELLPGLLPDR